MRNTLKILLLSVFIFSADAAEKITNGSFSQPVAPAGGSTNTVHGSWNYGVASWSETAFSAAYGAPTGSVDCVSATNPFAPIGTTSQFLDLLGISGTTYLRHDFTTTQGETYVLSFKAALRNDLHAPTGTVFFQVRGRERVLPWQLPNVWRAAITTYVKTGTSTNTDSTPVVTPVPDWWATNRWVTNTHSFVADAANMVLELYAAGGNESHAADVFIDDVSITGP